jgi:hypothetical protein
MIELMITLNYSLQRKRCAGIIILLDEELTKEVDK